MSDSLGSREQAQIRRIVRSEIGTIANAIGNMGGETQPGSGQLCALLLMGIAKMERDAAAGQPVPSGIETQTDGGVVWRESYADHMWVRDRNNHEVWHELPAEAARGFKQMQRVIQELSQANKRLSDKIAKASALLL